MATAPPATAPAAAIPLSRAWPEIRGVFSSTLCAETDGASAPPLTTLKSPKFDVAARSHCLPDLINLKRVTRSVSRYSPSFLLKNISAPF